MENEIQNQIKLFTHLNGLPKIDLHAHLNGSIRKQTLIELLSYDDKEKLEKLYPIMDFQNAMKFFAVTSKLINNIDIVRRITREVLDDWSKHNVIYFELRSTLKSIPDKFTKVEYLTAILEEIQKSNETRSMITRFIISLDRCKPISDYLETLEIYKNFENVSLKKLIVGIDYCGNEIMEVNKYEDVIPIFQQFRNEGLKVTVHMGENPNYQVFPFDKFQPDRIAHAYFLKDVHYIEFMKRKIHLEVCPTLSYKITHAVSFQDIPLKNFLRKKIEDMNGETFTYDNISINTDDTMLVLTDISQEYFEVASNFGLTLADLKSFVLNSINHIFETDEHVRQTLRDKVEAFPC